MRAYLVSFMPILYTDLYEGEQTSVAMGILKSFCCHANITWGRGLGIGGSNMAAVKKTVVFSRCFAIRAKRVQR